MITVGQCCHSSGSHRRLSASYAATQPLTTAGSTQRDYSLLLRSQTNRWFQKPLKYVSEQAHIPHRVQGVCVREDCSPPDRSQRTHTITSNLSVQRDEPQGPQSPPGIILSTCEIISTHMKQQLLKGRQISFYRNETSSIVIFRAPVRIFKKKTKQNKTLKSGLL